MTNIKYFALIMIFMAGLISCDLFYSEKGFVYNLYSKSYFLGETSFSISGNIYNEDGTPAHGNEFVANVGESNKDWSISYSLNGEGNFSLVIDKTEKGVTLSSETLSDYKFSSFYNEYFRYCPTAPAEDSPTGNIKITPLFFHFDDDGFITQEFIGSPKRPDEIGFTYIYICEPAKIVASFKNSDETLHYHYDLQFDKAGWYKIVSSDKIKITDNEKYFSTTDRKFQRWTKLY